MASFTGTWNYPAPVRFGAGRLQELPDACGELGISRPLLVTDRGLSSLSITKDAVGVLDAAGLPTAVYSGVEGNPTGQMVTDGVTAFVDGDHDGVVAFGGGSALDVAKAIAMMVGQTRPLFDFEDRADWWTRIDPAGMRPLVAVPTTSGTGSEVGRASVITDTSVHVKKIIFHPGMLPGRVICDPVLTAGLPRGVTAATGIDALSHNLEAWFAPGFHPLADGIALEGIRLIHRHLLRACTAGDDIDARAGMMAASLMGATAFQKGLGAMHAMAHPIGAVVGAHHGLTNAVVMPFVLQANRPAIAGRAADLARALDLPGHDFDALLGWVLELRSALDIPSTLADIGVTETQLPLLAKMATEDPSAGGNPVPFDEDFSAALFARAFSGEP
ncbi:MAG: iron-containing alcohol dehydrogenase [Myxococcota bacterium]|nr:iron-containing alcohol dehydrogenase [Myxococcota bacterium]